MTLTTGGPTDKTDDAPPEVDEFLATVTGIDGNPPPDPVLLPQEPALFEWSDMGNAQRLVTKHRDEFRFNYTTSRWLYWDGMRWATDRGQIRISQATMETFADLLAYSSTADPDVGKQAKKWWRQTQTAGRIKATLEIARHMAPFPVADDELDTDVDVLNCNNGTIDLKTGELKPHDPSNLITKLAPFDYDPDAKAPKFQKFLEQIFIDGKGSADQELIDYVRNVIGYSCTGSTAEQIVVVAHGGGSNGKSTLLNTFGGPAGLLGDYATAADDNLLTGRSEQHPTGQAALAGARFVMAPELDATQKLRESLVKRMTGGDPIAARMMREDFWEFVPQCTIFIAANSRPTITGTDNGIWRRIKEVPFLAHIPDEEQDDTLNATFRGVEASGVMNWAIQGAVSWYQDGLKTPQAVIAASNDYRASMDVVGHFLVERTNTAGDTSLVGLNDLYVIYTAWCEALGERHMPAREFNAEVAKHGYTQAPTGYGVLSWRGMVVKSLLGVQ